MAEIGSREKEKGSQRRGVGCGGEKRIGPSREGYCAGLLHVT